MENIKAWTEKDKLAADTIVAGSNLTKALTKYNHDLIFFPNHLGVGELVMNRTMANHHYDKFMTPFIIK
jgi:hypothetical protein